MNNTNLVLLLLVAVVRNSCHSGSAAENTVLLRENKIYYLYILITILIMECEGIRFLNKSFFVQLLYTRRFLCCLPAM